MPGEKQISSDAINLRFGIMGIVEEAISDIGAFHKKTSRKKFVENGDILLYIGGQLIAIERMPSLYQIRILDFPAEYQTSVKAKEHDKIQNTLKLSRNQERALIMRRIKLTKISNFLVKCGVNVEEAYRCPEVSVRPTGCMSYDDDYLNLFTPVVDFPVFSTCKVVKKVIVSEPAVVEETCRDILKPEKEEVLSSLSPKICDAYEIPLASRMPNKVLGEDGHTEFLRALRRCKEASRKYGSKVMAIVYTRNLSYALDMVTSQEHCFRTPIREVRVHADYVKQTKLLQEHAEKTIGINSTNSEVNAYINEYVSNAPVGDNIRQLVCYPSKGKAEIYMMLNNLSQAPLNRKEEKIVRNVKKFCKKR